MLCSSFQRSKHFILDHYVSVHSMTVFERACVMKSTENLSNFQNRVDQPTPMCQKSCCYSPNRPKRTSTALSNVSEGNSDRKRIKTMSEWLHIVEQVTPESAISSEVREVEPIRFFLCMQFEPENSQSRRSREFWITNALTGMLERACIANDEFHHDEGRGPYRSKEYPDGSTSIFFSLKKPSIVLRHYVLRLVRYLRVSKSVFVVALIYLDRVRHEDNLLSLNYLNVHRLLTTALALSAKYLEDESHKNSTIARIGGVPSTIEMNMLEVQFLRRIGWNCGVSEMAYEIYEKTAFGEEEWCERVESGRIEGVWGGNK